jgi:hypothetical protein
MDAERLILSGITRHKSLETHPVDRLFRSRLSGKTSGPVATDS